MWYLRQLLPLPYRTTYGCVGDAGASHLHTRWWMWFGRCFWVRSWIIPCS